MAVCKVCEKDPCVCIIIDSDPAIDEDVSNEEVTRPPKR